VLAKEPVMHHTSGYLGIILVVLVLLAVVGRLARSFRRTTRMMNRHNDWDPLDGPGPQDGGGGSAGGGGDAGGGYNG
jgi:uncharacterized membrane protein YgcG